MQRGAAVGIDEAPMDREGKLWREYKSREPAEKEGKNGSKVRSPEGKQVLKFKRVGDSMTWLKFVKGQDKCQLEVFTILRLLVMVMAGQPPGY